MYARVKGRPLFGVGALIFFFITFSSIIRVPIWSFLDRPYGGQPNVDAALFIFTGILCLVLWPSVVTVLQKLNDVAQRLRRRMHKSSRFAFGFLAAVVGGSLVSQVAGGSVFPFFSMNMFDERQPVEQRDHVVHSFSMFDAETNNPVSPREISLFPKYVPGLGLLDNTWSFATHFHRRETLVAMEQLETATGIETLPGIISYDFKTGSVEYVIGCDASDVAEFVSDQYGFPTNWLSENC